MLSNQYKVINSCLQLLKNAQSLDNGIVVGSPHWYRWLEDNQSFYYDGTAGTFSARKEKRPGGWYWYAYRKREGTLRSAYLGSNPELGYEHLEKIAALLARNELSTDSNFGVSPDKSSLISDPMVQGQTYLTSKISLPPLRSGFVARARLLARLAEGVKEEANNRLILVSAPAGYGKTTLLSEWAASYVKGLPAWMSLDETDNEAGRFWSYFMLALERAYPGLGEPSVASLQSPKPPSIEEILVRLLNSLKGRSNIVRIVLDDYHLITTKAIHRGLTFLVEHLPPQMQLLIASRSDPSLPLARLRVRYQLLEIRTEELRFDRAEATDFFNQAMQLTLAESDIATLAESTEGWVAGLQLAALSLRGQNRNSLDRLPAFDGNHQYLAEYLAAEVLAKQSPSIQDFLLQTSIVEHLNPELGEALTGQKCATLLRQIEQSNLFLLRLDQSSNWYRYHHLFAEFLVNRLQESDPEQVVQLHKRACQWYEAKGLIAEATSHALTAQDYEMATRLIEQEGLRRLMARGEVGMLADWLERLPVQLVQARPRLLMTLAWVHLFSGQLDIAEASLDRLKLETSLAQLTDVRPSNATELALSNDQDLVTAMLVTQATVATRRERTASAISLAKQALSRLPTDDALFRSAMFLDLGSAYFTEGDLVAARDAFEQAIAISRVSHNLMVELVTISRLGYLERECGHLQTAVRLYQGAFGQVTHHRPDGGIVRIPVGGLICGSLASILYEWNDLVAARRYITETLDLSPYLASQELPVSAYFLLSMLALAEGQTEQARQLVEQAEERRRQVGIEGKFGSFFAARRGQIYLALGDLPAVRQLLEERKVASLVQPIYEREDEQILLGRVWIVEGQIQTALDWFERLHKAALVGGRMGKVWLIQILQAQALYTADKTDEALRLLEATLRQTETEGYMRLYLDEGQIAASLLKRLQATPFSDHPTVYLNRILNAFTKSPLAATSSVEQPATSLVPRLAKPGLSRRELEVLTLLTKDTNNYAQIAEQLVISSSTLKKHLHHIYARLGVKNRRQAVTLAIQTGLITASNRSEKLF